MAAIIPYCSKDEWAYKKAKDDWDDYTGSPVGTTNAYPSPNGLDDMLEEMTQLMNTEIGTSSNITAAQYIVFLRNLCYRGVELMIDEEQGRATEEGRNVYIPRDYMYERDREKLRRIGLETKKRVPGGVTSG